MTNPTRLLLVRHGQTELNRESRFRGMSDIPLNERGRAEALAVARLLEDQAVGTVYTSPVPRSVETAELIARATGSDVIPDDGLIDIDYGGWQGLTVAEAEREFGAAMMENWMRDTGRFEFPGGDRMADVRARVAPALLEIAGENAGGTVAAVTHMAVLKVCFLVTMGLGFEWFWKVGIDNGSVSLFTHDEVSGFVLQFWNSTPPLEGA